MGAAERAARGQRLRRVLMRKAGIGMLFGCLNIPLILALVDGTHCGALRVLLAFVLVTIIFYGVPFAIALIAGALLTMALPSRVVAGYGWLTVLLVCLTVLQTYFTWNVSTSTACGIAT